MLLPSLAFIGPAGSGKSTASQFLVDHHNYTKYSFATPLKKIAAQLWDSPGRYELQELGVKVREIHPDTWSNKLKAILDNKIDTTTNTDIASHPRWVIDDCRFPNEYEMLRGFGFFFVRLEIEREEQVSRLTANGRFQTREQLDHESEHALDSYGADATIDTTDLDTFDLYAEVVRLMGRWQIR